MNPRILAVPVAAAAIAICLYIFASRDKSASTVSPVSLPAKPVGAQPGTARGNDPASDKLTSTAGKKPAVNWALFGMLSDQSAASTSGIPVPDEADIARFLAKHGETPANLVAAFEIAKDRRWLDRALELFPNSPLVLMRAIETVPNAPAKAGEKLTPDPARLALIERFKAADPNNPVPWIFAAQELFKAGPTAEAVAEIRAALERPAFYVYANERMDAAQWLYESHGLGPLEASALAMFGLTLPHMQAANQSSRMLMEWQKSAVESGDTASSNEALRLTYELGRTFATPEASRMLIGQIVGFAMERRALDALPADAQPDWLKVSPAQRIAEIEQKKADVKGITTGIESVIRSQDAELLAEYLRRMRTESEWAAFVWLKTQKK